MGGQSRVWRGAPAHSAAACVSVLVLVISDLPRKLQGRGRAAAHTFRMLSNRPASSSIGPPSATVYSGCTIEAW